MTVKLPLLEDFRILSISVYCIFGVFCCSILPILLSGGKQAGSFVLGILGLLVISTLLRKPFVRWFDWLIFFLPFIQALSVKVGIRWNLSEVLAWLLFSFCFSRQHASVRIPSFSARCYYQMIILFTIYNFIITPISLLTIVPHFHEFFGLTSVGFQYFYSPWLRAGVELGRLVACATVVAASFFFLSSEGAFMRGLKIFALSGVAANVYGLYQLLANVLGLSLPMLPGTLGTSESRRIWGTFYEPVGFGSYMVMTTIVMLFLSKIDTGRRLLWMLGVFFTIVGILLSVAATAWLAIFLAIISLLIFGKKTSVPLISSMIILTVILGKNLNNTSLAENILDRNFNLVFLDHRLEGTIEAAYKTRKWLFEYPLGIGEGLLIFLYGGSSAILRLSVESGFPGMIVLLIAQLCVLISIAKLSRSPSAVARSFFPYALALDIALIPIGLKYNYPFNLWLWFVMTLPVVASVLPVPGKQLSRLKVREGED